jgi:hypothetical protein
LIPLLLPHGEVFVSRGQIVDMDRDGEDRCHMSFS